MSEEWPVTFVPESIEDFTKWLSTISRDPLLIYRGQPDAEWELRASLDRNVPEDSSYQDRLNRLEKEKEDIQSFRDQAFPFLGDLESVYVNDYVGCMTVMQHFGAPTRLLDWTKSVAIAAYFACIDECSRDGAIWWINTKAVVDSVHPHWEARGFRRKPELGCEIDLNSGIFNPDVDKFISLTNLRVRFPRAQAQRGLFTIGSRLGIAHDAVLKAQVSEDHYGRITIPANLKSSVIGYLKRMGIDAVSLQYPRADQIALRMAWERTTSPTRL